MKQARVVCFGAGRVAGPFVSYLLRRTAVSICLVDAVAGQAEALLERCAKGGSLDPSRVTCMAVDIMDTSNDAAVHQLCEDADCVVALVPEPAQVFLARKCIATKTPLVTASYVSPSIKELDEEAKRAGIPILSEMGLDPGMVRFHSCHYLLLMLGLPNTEVRRFVG